MRRRDHERITSDLRDEVRYLRRINENLVDRLMHLSGATWTSPPPAEFKVEEPEPYEWNPDQTLDAVDVLDTA